MCAASFHTHNSRVRGWTSSSVTRAMPLALRDEVFVSELAQFVANRRPGAVGAGLCDSLRGERGRRCTFSRTAAKK